MVDFRLPNINANTLPGQIGQIQSYLYQLVEQLNWAMNTLDSAQNGDTQNVVVKPSRPEDRTPTPKETFDSIKSLIIKSADIINAYSEELKRTYDGVYTAQSDFGTYRESTNAAITENSTNIATMYSSIQEIIPSVAEIQHQLMETSAYTRSGLLGYNDSVPIYGFEVGQKTTVDGQETFNKFARFTAGGINFYLPGATDPVAYMTGTTLFISNATVTGSLNVGGYRIDTSNGIAFKWIGG